MSLWTTRLRHLGTSAVLVLAWLGTGCVGKTPPASVPPADPLAFDTFKVLTYNTLHGLNVGRVWVTADEPPAQHEARFRLQVQQIAKAQPALILLQEVNPLPDRAEDYVKALAAAGLSYTQVHQVDACGIRLGKPLALIPPLNNGLAILARTELRLQKVEGLKLSGVGACRDRAGFQLTELRYALIASVTSPRSGKRYLVVDVHLHSGIEGDGYLLRRLNGAQAEGRLQHVEHLKAALVQDEEVRIAELHALVEELHRLNAHQAYAGLLLGGDFNFEPGDPEYQELIRLGLQDTYLQAIHKGEIASYDPRYDVLTKDDVNAVPDEVKRAIADLPADEHAAIEAAYLADVRRPRRIDFLFSLSLMPTRCLTQERFGVETAPGGLPGSDHYGVLNTYTYRHKPCPRADQSAAP